MQNDHNIPRQFTILIKTYHSKNVTLFLRVDQGQKTRNYEINVSTPRRLTKHQPSIKHV